jgi:hypothetical protein
MLKIESYSGFRVQGSRFRVQRSRVQGSRVRGSRFRVQGSALKKPQAFRVQSSILVAGLHLGCVFTKKASASQV